MQYAVVGDSTKVVVDCFIALYRRNRSSDTSRWSAPGYVRCCLCSKQQARILDLLHKLRSATCIT
jgi:hypothetical protein